MEAAAALATRGRVAVGQEGELSMAVVRANAKLSDGSLCELGTISSLHEVLLVDQPLI